MPTINISISLPDGMFELARERGLLEPEAVSELVLDATRNDPSRKTGDSKSWPKGEPLPEGVPSEIARFVHPELYGKGKILGDIVSPIDVEWEAMQ